MAKRIRTFFKLKDIRNISRTPQSSCEIYENYRIENHILGEGSYGKVMVACNNNVCEYVAKIITFDFSRYDARYVYNLFFAECLITQFAGDKGFGCPVKTFYLCDEGKKGVIIMEKYEKDLETIKNSLTLEDMKQIIDKVTTMHEYGILHRDLFLKNTMYKTVNDKKDIRIIDFGLTIPFEHKIPLPFRAIDYLNLISDIPDETLKQQCHNYIISKIGKGNVQIGEKWIASHFNTCSSEYSLLKHIPLKWVQLIGPATVDSLVWSVRCSPELDKDIIQKVEHKVSQLKIK